MITTTGGLRDAAEAQWSKFMITAHLLPHFKTTNTMPVKNGTPSQLSRPQHRVQSMDTGVSLRPILDDGRDRSLNMVVDSVPAMVVVQEQWA